MCIRDRASRELFNLTPKQLVMIFLVLQMLALACVIYYGFRSFSQDGSGFMQLLEQQQKAHIMFHNLFKN